MDKLGSVVPREDYRPSTFTCDRKNQRHGIKGIKGSHRTSLDRRSSKGDERCPFTCSIFLDSAGYYLKTATNTFVHQFHARRDHIRTSTSLLNDEENQVLCDLSSARAKTGVAANLHYVRSGRRGTNSILSNAQIKALLKKNPHQDDGKGTDESMNGSGEIDDLYHFLERSGSHYVSLLARVVPDETTSDSPPDSPPRTVLFNETRLGHTKDQEDVVIAADEEQDMLRVVSAHRQLLPIADSQEMMVGIAYAMPFEVRQFQLFNVCLHIDATADSNKEGRPLVTVSSKDSYGKMFIVLRAFLPNEQSWSYKWFFQTVLPALVGKESLRKIKNIVTDGNSQEIGQLDDTIASFFPEAYRIRCSWHIIDRGWHKKVNVALGGKSRKKRALTSIGQPRQPAAPLTNLNKTARTIYRWMFSWAQPFYCETQEEYFLSKALFMKFVASRQVGEILGMQVGESIVKFARESVFPHEERMAYYKRHSLFHLETHTNCGHEGTNNGMKHCATPVMPQNRLDRAVQTLHLNATMKAGNSSIHLCHKSNSKKSWSDSPTAKYVTDPCESMLQREWCLSSTWIPHRVSQHRWLLVHSTDAASSDTSSEDSSEDEDSHESVPKNLDSNTFGPIPRFSCVYEVTVEQDLQVFACTCCHQERMGMP